MNYSYAHKADPFRRALDYEEGRKLMRTLLEAALRRLRARLGGMAIPTALVLACPRRDARSLPV